MTEKLPPLAATPDKPEKAKVQEDEGIITCICDFTHDDGDTVYCERCNTWQHINCYYPLSEAEKVKQEDFDHSCVHCSPRPLDKQKAVERQQLRLGLVPPEEDHHDRKASKKAPSKAAQKRKVKPNDLQLKSNTLSTTDGSKHGSPQDHNPPAKKAKASHKSCQSVSSQMTKQSPSDGASKVIPGHPLSPATTPPDLPNAFEIHHYTQQFLALYDESDVQIVDTNTYANLKTQTTVSVWLKPGHEDFRKDTGREFKDVIQKTTPPLLDPPLHVEYKEVSLSRGTVLHLQYLRTQSAIDKDVPMMELNGLINLQKEYCEGPENHWSELCAPLPFVFFPPSLPLCIDARKEGSHARYVRRSCKPNASLDTYLSDGSVYHFWLVSDRPIAANEQVTLPWEFRFPSSNQERMVRLLGLGEEEMNGHYHLDIDQTEYLSISDWIRRILSEYGGCACDLGNDCAFARFHRNYYEKVQSRSNTTKRKRAKTKTHTLSPTSPDQAINSRAASESHQDDAMDNDGTSVAGSSRSKPPSRDMAPARHGSFDTLGILTEPTNRDRRKVQMAENLFQKSAHEQQMLPRKKKKASVDCAANSSTSKTKGQSSISQPPDTTDGAVERCSVDTGTFRRKTESPTSAAPLTSLKSAERTPLRNASIASASRRSLSDVFRNYCDVSVQTDPPPEQSPRSRPKRRAMSLTMRLMAQKRTDTLLAQQRPASLIDVDSPWTVKSPHESPSLHNQSSLLPPGSAAEMDAPGSDTPSMLRNIDAARSILINGIEPAHGPNKIRSPKLRVAMPPPAFTIPVSSSTDATTPTSIIGSTTQSPFSSANIASSFVPPNVNVPTPSPSPIKKKMSLSEYKNKANKAAASAKSALDNPHPLKTAASVNTLQKAGISGDHPVGDLDQVMADSKSRQQLQAMDVSAAEANTAGS